MNDLRRSICMMVIGLALVHTVLSAEGDVRLKGWRDSPGGQVEGRLEIEHRGEWGTVCDDGFDETAATVVCRMLDYDYGSMFPRATAGPGRGPIWMSDVMCSGGERVLTQCGYEGWGITHCTHDEDVAVQCWSRRGSSSSSSSGSSFDSSYSSSSYTFESSAMSGHAPLRLINGRTRTSGRLEIEHNDEWGTICDDGFDDQAAKVACKQLGLIGGRARGRAHYGAGTGPVWLADVYCNGYERALDDCQHAGWGITHCRHDEDVGIDCY